MIKVYLNKYEKDDKCDRYKYTDIILYIIIILIYIHMCTYMYVYNKYIAQRIDSSC